MTKVHAVSEVEDINYKVKSYYDGVVNDAILRIENNWENLSDGQKTNLLADNVYLYFYYGTEDGSSYNNAVPVNNNSLRVAWMSKGSITTNATISNFDYMGVTGYTMYLRTGTQGILFTNSGIQTFKDKSVYIPQFINGYIPYNWYTYISSKRSGDTETIISLLNDIKSEQQATNEFLNEETDESNMVIDTPSVTDSASDNMSNDLHNQINTLTTNLQTTVSNYYEGQDAYTWRIPLPSYIGGDIRFDSGVTRRIIGNSGVVYNIIQAIWVVLFGGYIVGFIKRMLDWVQTGKIFDEGGIADFIWWMDTNNEIIKASMM